MTKFVDTIRVALAAQGLADTRAEDAQNAWVIVAGEMAAEYGAEWRKYTANPASKSGPIDNRHSEAFMQIRDAVGLAAAKDAPELARIVAFVDNPDARGDDTLTASVMFKGKIAKVQRTKKAWQSWRADLIKTLVAKTAAADKATQPRVPRQPKTPQEQIRDHFTKVEAIVQKAKDLPFDATDFLNSLKILNRMV